MIIIDTLILSALDLAASYYDKKTFTHALRVARYAIADPQVDKSQENTIFAAALLHDILEDTDIDIVMLRVYTSPNIASIVEEVSQRKDESYSEYMEDLLDHGSWEAIIIKRADYKDHFSQVETLTPKLIEKYTPYIGRLM